MSSVLFVCLCVSRQVLGAGVLVGWDGGGVGYTFGRYLEEAEDDGFVGCGAGMCVRIVGHDVTNRHAKALKKRLGLEEGMLRVVWELAFELDIASKTQTLTAALQTAWFLHGLGPYWCWNLLLRP